MTFTKGLPASESLTDIKVKLNHVKVFLNRKQVNSDSIIYKGITYILIRQVAEALRRRMDFDSKFKSINIKDKSKNSNLKIHKNINLKSTIEVFEKEYPSGKI